MESTSSRRMADTRAGLDVEKRKLPCGFQGDRKKVRREKQQEENERAWRTQEKVNKDNRRKAY
jgi:hypothetical protein